MGLLFSIALSLSAHASSDRILVLQESGQLDHWWSEEQLVGIRQAFTDNSQYRLHVERLDLLEFGTENYKRELSRFLMRKYAPIADEFRGIIICDEDALDFYLKHIQPQWGNIPFTFSAVREPLPESLLRSKLKYAGVIQTIGYRETISAALNLQPNTRRIVVASDRTKVAQKSITEIQAIAPEFPVKFEFVGAGTFEQTARALEALGPGDIVIRLRLYVDSEGKMMSAEQSLKFLREHTKVPMYGFSEGLINKGLIGGKLLSGVIHGRQAGHLMIGLIENPADVQGRLVRAGTGRYIFNYEQLQRFGLDPARLPSDSTIVNRPVSFYQMYKRQVWALVGILLFLFVLVLALLWINSKLRVARYTLLKAKKAAEEASNIKSRFLANMSHEIRTPLGAVLGFAELLGSSDLSPAQREDLIGKIKRHGTALTSIVDDILDLSRVEAGRIQIEKIKVMLPELLNDIISTVKFRASEKAIGLSISSNGPIPKSITTDPTRLRQVLGNIIGNAIKFTEKGGVNVMVSFDKNENRTPVNQLTFLISDTGRGLSEKEASKLFEPFIQADSSTTRKYGGTGLGLILSRELARALGGDVQLIRYEVNHGCTFSITLDAGDVEGEWVIHDLSDIEQPAVVAPPRKASPIPDLTGVKVLLAEDSPDNQVLESRFLKMAGAEVDIAENGAESIDKAMHEKYDVILMDIQMPVLDGIAATSQLRTMGFKNPIIALSAHALSDQKRKSLEAGCNCHLTKPINRATLLNTVAQFAHPPGG